MGFGLVESIQRSLMIMSDGELDAEKLSTGNYILEGVLTDDHGRVDPGRFNLKTREKITLICGNTAREMIVLGHVVANPNTNTNKTWIGSIFYLPGDVFRELTGINYAMSYAFNAADDRENDMEAFLKQYTKSVEPVMNYNSKYTVMSSLNRLRNTAVLIGGSLGLIVGFIGILNFINAVLTSILTRRREFALLQGIGMTRKQNKSREQTIPSVSLFNINFYLCLVILILNINNLSFSTVFYRFNNFININFIQP